MVLRVLMVSFSIFKRVRTAGTIASNVVSSTGNVRGGDLLRPPVGVMLHAVPAASRGLVEIESGIAFAGPLRQRGMAGGLAGEVEGELVHFRTSTERRMAEQVVTEEVDLLRGQPRWPASHLPLGCLIFTVLFLVPLRCTEVQHPEQLIASESKNRVPSRATSG